MLPYDLFNKDVSDGDVCLDAVKELALKYRASLTATSSRFAVSAREPCASVLSEDGQIRYVSRSKFLKELGGWINFNVAIPTGTVAHRLFNGGSETEDSDELASDVWFNSSVKHRPTLVEEAIFMREWNQCLSLLWFDERTQPAGDRRDDDDEDEPLLRELDGTLSWPSKSRRR